MTTALDVKILLPELQLVEEFAAAFAARRLPEKFFYWFPLSVRAWLDLCGSGPYRNFSRSHLLTRRFCAQPDGLPVAPLDVWSLGPGNGEKDLLLLNALRTRGGPLRYRAVDVSVGLLEAACRSVADAGFAVEGFKADLTQAPHRAALAASAGDPPRLYLLLGNTLGALDPLAFAPALGGMLRPQDHLLLDGEIAGTPAETLAGYDHPINRRFAFAPLTSLGLTEEDGALRFEYLEDPRRPGLTHVAKSFRARRAFTVHLAGNAFPVAADETIAMSSSHKYTRDAFRSIVTELAGLHILREEFADDGRYVMALTQPAPRAATPDRRT